MCYYRHNFSLILPLEVSAFLWYQTLHVTIGIEVTKGQIQDGSLSEIDPYDVCTKFCAQNKPFLVLRNSTIQIHLLAHEGTCQHWPAQHRTLVTNHVGTAACTGLYSTEH